MKNLTLAQIEEMATNLVMTMQSVYGYDTALYNGFHMHRTGSCQFSIDLLDDFQKDLDSSHKIKHGYCLFLELNEETGLPDLKNWPKRAEREARVLARTLGSVNAEKFISAGARAIIEEMQPRIEELRNQIEDHS